MARSNAVCPVRASVWSRHCTAGPSPARLAKPLIELRTPPDATAALPRPSFARQRSGEFRHALADSTLAEVLRETPPHRGPDIDLQRTERNVARLFRLAIRRGSQPWEQYSAKRFLDEVNTLVVSPALLKRLPLRKLETSRNTLFSQLNRGRAIGRTGLWRLDIMALRRRDKRYDHYFVVLLATLDGLGLSIGPMPVLAHDVQLGRLCTPFPKITVRRPSYFVLTPLDADKPPIMHAFIDWLVTVGAEPQTVLNQLFCVPITIPWAGCLGGHHRPYFRF